MSRPPERQCRPRCSGEIEQCLACPYDEHDCIAVDAGNPIRVDDFVKGTNIFVKSAVQKRKKKSALLSGN